MYSQEFFQEVRESGLPSGGYALFGSAQLCVRGLRSCHDMDIIVTQPVWEACLADGRWVGSVAPSGSPSLKKGNLELVRTWMPGEWDVDRLIAEAETIEGLPFVKLDQVLAWKRISGREKDRDDVELIEQFMQSSS